MASPVFDNSASNGVASTGQTSIPDFTLSVGNNSNRIVVVFVTARGTGTPTPTVTVGGSAVTLWASYSYEPKIWAYYFLAPSTGNNTISVSFSSAVNYPTAIALSYHGVSQADPVGSASQAHADNSISISVSCASDSGQIALSCWAGNGWDTSYVSCGDTQRVLTAYLGDGSGASEKAGASPNVTLKWSSNEPGSPTGWNWSALAGSLKGIAAGRSFGFVF